MLSPGPFMHYVFRKRDCIQSRSTPVFVFLDGDGNSWIRGGRVSEDPTPTHAVALGLLAADEACGVYIARPCTFGLALTDAACLPDVWTLDRYSSTVIESLRAVVESVVPRNRPIVLVGYSGGGWIASHLAKRIPRTRGLITLGANLDLEAWVVYHGYTRSIASRSPSSPFPLEPRIVQLHVFGDRDRISPVELARGVLGQGTDGSILMIEGADHGCCWEREWPSIRAAFQQRIDRLERIRPSSSER